MKKSSLPGMIKYSSIREALREIAKKTEEKHYESVRKLAAATAGTKK